MKKKPLQKLYRNPYFWGAVIGIIFVTAVRPFLRYIPDPPPTIGYIPEFTLINQDNVLFGSHDLKGTVYVANFFSSDCSTPCMDVFHAMKTLQKKISDKDIPIKLVSFNLKSETTHSVTPHLMRGPLLKRSKNALYLAGRVKHGMTKHQQQDDIADVWIFLRGTEKEMNQLINTGFKIHYEKLSNQSRILEKSILFEKLVIVDQNGGLRGFYSTDELGIDEVFHRSQHVLTEIMN